MRLAVGFPLALAAGFIIVFGGCRKRAASMSPPAADSASVTCPDPGTFAGLRENGRDLRTTCAVLEPRFYWVGVALTFEAKTGQHAQLSVLFGGPSMKPMVFSIEPLPTGDLEKLLSQSRDIAVQIRPTPGDRSLVRLGVLGDQREIGVLLDLVAHAPPRLLWVGAGDRVSVQADGCRVEQVVDFQRPFSSQLEMVTTQRAHAVGKASNCPASSATQEPVSIRPRQLAVARPLPPAPH